VSTEEKTSLADDLGDVYDSLTEEEVEETDDVTVEDAEKEEAASDEVIIIKAEDESDEEEQIEVAEDEEKLEAAVEEEEEEEDDVEPLAHWLKKDKEEFKGLPKNAKEFLVRRDKEFQRHANDKVQESLSIKRALEPIREELVQFGVPEDQAVRTLVGAHVMLKNDPKMAIRQLMNTYKLSPEELFNTDDTQPESDPRVDALENKVTNYEQLMAEREQAALSGRLEEFKKNAEFFDDVMDEMTELAMVERARNPAVVPDIEKLYNKACQMNDTVRVELLKRERAADGKVESTQRSKNAAGTKVKTTPVSKKRKEKTGPKSVRDDLSAVWDEIEERDKTGIAL